MRYGGTGQVRDDGDANYGFKDPKGDLSLVGLLAMIYRTVQPRYENYSGTISLMTAPHRLDFALLDDVSLAVQRKDFDASAILQRLEIERIGPLVELLILSRNPSRTSLSLVPLPSTKLLSFLRKAIRSECSFGRCSNDEKAGFILTTRNPRADDPVMWTAFCLSAQQGAIDSGLAQEQAKGLVGAMREIEENIHLHSQRTHDGLVAYRATRDEFEFVVADSGIGALASLRQSPDYEHVTDPGIAIQVALKDGESRLKYKSEGHGYGFRQLFVGLANLNASLRFRSDDHSLTINGDSPVLMAMHLGQTSRLQGFFVNVVCKSAGALQLY